jgi:cell division protein FtsI/penicillin-binding protein 2
MAALGKWAGVGIALGALIALPKAFHGQVDPARVLKVLAKQAPPVEDTHRFEGLDLTQLDIHPRRVATSLSDSRQAILTLDPELQRSAESVMKRYSLPEAGAVLMDVHTGQMLVYASHVNQGPVFDFNARAEAPSASVFKVVTSAALIEFAGLSASTEQCYHGGKSRIDMSELVDDPARDKWCATMATALGRSLNVVFARLAKKNLSTEQLAAMAGAFGFGGEVPFEAVNEPTTIEVPDDPLEFARASAGFWHSTLSPLLAVSLVQTVANEGVTMRPFIVQRIEQGDRVEYEHGDPQVLRRAIRKETALELTSMMTQTTLNGTAFRAFHDKRGRPYLPGVVVAGKTGTLTRHELNRFYTWFVGFAPADAPQVAVAALVVNTPVWKIKGPDLAREVLKSYFQKHPAADAH